MAEPADLDTVLGKAVGLLRAFTMDDGVLTLAELVRRTGLAKGNAHRVAGDLVHHGLLDRTELGYRLSSGLFELGMRAASERTLLELAMPFLQDLYELTHETVHLGVQKDTEVFYVAKFAGHRQAHSPSRTGGRMPLHCTAIGKALLAHADNATQKAVLTAPLERRTPHTITAPGLLHRQLSRARANGVAYEHEESALGLVCVAAPVLAADRTTAVAAISVTGPGGRFRPERYAEPVRVAANGLAALVARRRSLA